ncbi:MAG: hypothetical protein ACRC5M_04465 [Anaeroplasmataceae bacterium]
MTLTTATKSRVILGLIRDVPGLMTLNNVKKLAIDPNNNVLGFEDAAEAIDVVQSSNEQSVEDMNDLANMFPNARLSAELEIVKETDRTKFKEFTDKMFELNSLTKEIETEAGPLLDFLLDELVQNADPKSVSAVKNMGVEIINVQDGKIS